MNKIIRMVTLMAGVGAMLCFAGCGGSGPDKVAVKFFESLSEGDIDAACKYASKPTGALLAAAKSMGGDNKDFEKMKGVKFEAVETKIDGNSAEVKLKMTKDGKSEVEKEPVTLIKEDGEWKVSIKKD